MQTLNYRFPAKHAATHAVHIGVVASGDLEILLEPTRRRDPRARMSGCAPASTDSTPSGTTS